MTVVCPAGCCQSRSTLQGTQLEKSSCGVLHQEEWAAWIRGWEAEFWDSPAFGEGLGFSERASHLLHAAHVLC